MASTPLLPAEPEPAAGGAAGVRTWSIGTLAYTSGGLSVLFAWLLWGDFAWWIKERALWPLVPLILKRFEASDMITGVFMGTLPAVILLVLAPVVSCRSDRHRGRWGRRIPYLIISTPVASFGLIGCAFSATFGGWLHAALGPHAWDEKLLSLICFGFFWTIFELATVVSNALFQALINDVVPHALLGRFFGLFRAVSLLAGIIFNLFLLDAAQKAYVITFVSIGVLYGAGFLMMCLRVKEGDYPPIKDAAAGPIGLLAEIMTYFRECFSSMYWVWVFVAVSGGLVVFVPVNLFSVLYAKSVGVEMNLFGRYIAITFAISIAIAYFLGVLADLYHPVRLAIIVMSAYVALCIWGGLAANTAGTFAFALIGHGVISGAFFTTTASIQQRLFPRVRFGQFASAAGIITALANVVVSPAVGQILDVTDHNYRNTFFASGAIGLMALVAFIMVYRLIGRYGGLENYVAPDT